MTKIDAAMEVYVFVNIHTENSYITRCINAVLHDGLFC